MLVIAQRPFKQPFSSLSSPPALNPPAGCLAYLLLVFSSAITFVHHVAVVIGTMRQSRSGKELLASWLLRHQLVSVHNLGRFEA
jgi:hypothetical protein